MFLFLASFHWFLLSASDFLPLFEQNRYYIYFPRVNKKGLDVRCLSKSLSLCCAQMQQIQETTQSCNRTKNIKPFKDILRTFVKYSVNFKVIRSVNHQTRMTLCRMWNNNNRKRLTTSTQNLLPSCHRIDLPRYCNPLRKPQTISSKAFCYWRTSHQK